MEQKARALAECSFEDPVLAEPLPGRLGEALCESVLVLSGSIVERESLQQRLAHQATHDALTGLHNRASANEFLEQALARSGRSGQPLAVLFIDLDDFKRANDTHGHAVGDAILKEIALRMTQAARRGDFLARLGGDEFLVIAEGIGDGAEASAIGARARGGGQPADRRRRSARQRRRLRRHHLRARRSRRRTLATARARRPRRIPSQARRPRPRGGL
jgi:GGDEF domain-containing protein